MTEPGLPPIERQLARLVGTFHNISYYAPEMKAFADLGLPEYWRAYMAYRSAPLGQVPAAVVTSTFYNFAPAMVGAAIPSAWETTSPAAVLRMRDESITRALGRALGAEPGPSLLAEAADLLFLGIEDAPVGARPLYAAHRELPVPADPLVRLWHGCTLWREYRGDGHNLALATSGIDGIECHVLLAAKGVGNQSVIGKIRGWTSDEWDAALARLVDRGLVLPSGEFTDQGRALRRDIELATDHLASAPGDRLGPSRSTRLVELLEPLVARLVETGAVAASWPPRRPPA